MKIFECKCGSTEVFIEQQGNNCGLYCADCGKWITWLNKDSKRLAERQIQGIEKEIRNNAIYDFVEKAREKFEEFDREHGYPTVEDCQIILKDVCEELEECEDYANDD